MESSKRLNIKEPGPDRRQVVMDAIHVRIAERRERIVKG